MSEALDLRQIDYIIDSAIKFNRSVIDARQIQQNYLGPVEFAKEIATVRLNLGRQLGHSMAIARRATTRDVVIVHRQRSVPKMKQRLAVWNMAEISINDSLRLDSYDTVWVDEATYRKDIDDIYEKYAHRAKQFVLLG